MNNIIMMVGWQVKRGSRLRIPESFVEVNFLFKDDKEFYCLAASLTV